MIVPLQTDQLPELAPFRNLTERQLRNDLDPSRGIFIAESPKVIEAALDASYEPVSLLTEERHIEGDAQSIIGRLGSGVPVFTGPRELLASLTGYELTRGVLCAMRRKPLLDVATICVDCKRVTVVDNVSNATNIGAIFRAAAALGIDAVLMTSTSCDPLNRRSVRVSMGTVFKIPWTLIQPLHRGGLCQLRSLGFKCVALALSDDALLIQDPKLKSLDRIALIFGSEGYGLEQEAIEQCDYVAKIPMSRGVDSLNVAAASAVAFWELRSNHT